MHIRDWDFRWQHVYRLIEPLPLPKGTRLSMDYTYDNSPDNIRNPEVPPRRVLWGQRSKDEMGDLWFQLLTKTEGDRERLNGEIATKMVAEDIIGYETMLTVTPGDYELHDDVALLYLGSGRPADAVRHFEASVKARPDSAAARYNLGTALAVGGQLDRAVLEYERAIALNPKYAVALANLGSVLLQQGRTLEAVRRLEQAVALSPENVEGLNSLSVAYAAQGNIDKALATIDRALKLQPSPQIQKLLRERQRPAPPEVAARFAPRSPDLEIEHQIPSSPDPDRQPTKSRAHQITAVYRADPDVATIDLITGSSSAFVICPGWYSFTVPSRLMKTRVGVVETP